MSIRSSQPEYRKDPLSDAWVVVATERTERPEEFREVATRKEAERCPFCAGREEETPAAIGSYRLPDDDFPWRVRVVPNKYPAVVRFAELGEGPSPHAFRNGTPNLYTTFQGHGGHEVVIESPTHAVSLTDLALPTVELMFRAYRDRMQSLAHEGRWNYVQVFKNVGAAAGSSIEHAHSQIIGLPAVPVRVREEIEHTREYMVQKGTGLIEDMIAAESKAGVRIVAENEDFIALCPFASRFCYETWVIPKKRSPRFETCEDALLGKLASLMSEVIGRIECAGRRPAYNYLIHSAPFDSTADDHYHWHIEIIPRITKTAGFEWGTGYYINPVSPERAASALREASVSVTSGSQ